ncbi:MAG: MFS transporter [Nocardioidaceae bacterium]|nr:MFS transporter [Nocardioidaceae bacterium]
MSPTFQALSVRNFRLYSLGGVVSNTGTWMQRVAQDWLVLELTDSGSALGITTGLQFLPFLLVSPFAGLVADRYSKRRMLALTQASLALSAGLLGLLAVTGLVEVWHVYVLALLFGIGTAFDAPARQSFVIEMVGPDNLPNAVGLNSASFNLGRIVGPAVAGLLIAALGSGVSATGWVILLNAVSYAAVLGSLRAMRRSELSPSEPLPRAKGALREGVRYVRARPDLIFVFVVAFATGTFGLNFQMTMALMATSEFHKGAGEFGLLGSCMAVGSLAGALLAARRGYPRRLVLVLSALTFALAEIVAGLMPTYWLFAAWLPVVGVTALTLLNSLQMVVQLSVDADIRGRIMALYMMVFMGGTPFGAPIVGWIGETFGARWTLIGGGLATLLAVVLATAWLMRAQHIGWHDISLHPNTETADPEMSEGRDKVTA